mmetsp:Transcript_12883/g.30565  ORF Transcript_12883/g.30565 Transcript_12883/m.30565 type:complete len:200 (-) Transcript_12883:270-869(-)
MSSGPSTTFPKSLVDELISFSPLPKSRFIDAFSVLLSNARKVAMHADPSSAKDSKTSGTCLVVLTTSSTERGHLLYCSFPPLMETMYSPAPKLAVSISISSFSNMECASASRLARVPSLHKKSSTTKNSFLDSAESISAVGSALSFSVTIVSISTDSRCDFNRSLAFSAASVGSLNRSGESSSSETSLIKSSLVGGRFS